MAGLSTLLERIERGLKRAGIKQERTFTFHMRTRAKGLAFAIFVILYKRESLNEQRESRLTIESVPNARSSLSIESLFTHRLEHKVKVEKSKGSIRQYKEE